MGQVDNSCRKRLDKVRESLLHRRSSRGCAVLAPGLLREKQSWSPLRDLKQVGHAAELGHDFRLGAKHGGVEVPEELCYHISLLASKPHFERWRRLVSFSGDRNSVAKIFVVAFDDGPSLRRLKALAPGCVRHRSYLAPNY